MPLVTLETVPPDHTVVLVHENITISCLVRMSPSVDSPVVVNTLWRTPSRGDVSSSSMVSPGMMYMFTRTQTWSTLDTTDAGNYICSVTLSPNNSQFIAQATQTAITLGKKKTLI